MSNEINWYTVPGFWDFGFWNKDEDAAAIFSINDWVSKKV